MQPHPPVPRCPACADPVAAADRFCAGCGQRLDPRVPSPPAAEDQPPGAAQDMRLGCEACGARYELDGRTRCRTCAFCDTPAVLEPAPSEDPRTRPEFVVPFEVGPEAARQRWRAWLEASSWYHPRDLGGASLDGLQGLYLPFWVFAFEARSRWSASIGEAWVRDETVVEPGPQGLPSTRTREVRETEWYPLSGSFRHDHPGVWVGGGRALDPGELRRLGSFRPEDLRPYDAAYLVGWANEECTRDPGEAEALAEARVLEDQRNRVRRFLPGDSYQDLRVDTELRPRTRALVFAPVYLVTFCYRGQTYRYLLNGQTGHESGQRPLSAPRLLAAALLVLLGLWWWLRLQAGGAP